MWFSRVVRAAAGHGHHAKAPYVYLQGPNDAIFSKAIPIAFTATGAGIVVFGIYSFMFTESGN